MIVGLVTIIVYKLWLPNPIDYTYSIDPFSQAAIDLLKISLVELLIFGPILLGVILITKRMNTIRIRVHP